MEYIIDDNKLMWTLEAKPDKIDNKKYIIYSEKYGIYNKKEAEIICNFLRNGNLLNISYSAKS